MPIDQDLDGRSLTKRQLLTFDIGSIIVVQAPGTQALGTGFDVGITYKKLRETRKDATVSFARALAAAPVLASEWAIESDGDVRDEPIEFVRDQLFPKRLAYMDRATYGSIDFGWQGFEKVFAVVDGRLVLTRLKPLLHDITSILIDQETGVFQGFYQDRDQVYVPPDRAVLVNINVEGDELHGEGMLEIAHVVQKEWAESQAAAQLFNNKVAGSRWVLHYPMGESTATDGTKTDNSEIAKAVLKSMVTAGAVAIPNREDEGGKRVWELELKGDSGGSGRQQSFVTHLQYLDTQKLRAFLLPERSAVEGRFGTKAEASTHVEVAMTIIQLMNERFTGVLNETVDQLLTFNFGPELRGKVRLSAAPLQTGTLERLRGVYEAILKSPLGFAGEFDTIDTDALKDTLGVPKAKGVAQAGEDEPDGDAEPLE